MPNDAIELRALFDAACKRLDARSLVVSALASVPTGARLVALGKMAHPMASAALQARPDLVPLLSVGTDEGPEGWMRAGDHPVPGERSFANGRELLRRVRASDGAPILCLISGGGSALAEAPAVGLDERDLVETNRALLASALSIGDVNAVRKTLSGLKAGRLALAAPQSAWQVFILSDVVGDDVGAVASGPCTPDPTAPERALHACRQAGLIDALPSSVRLRLERQDPPSSDSPFAVNVQTTLLAGPRDLGATLGASSPLPRTVLEPTNESVETLARRYGEWARRQTEDALLVSTGEPLLEIRGRGRGGRAQHLALLVAREIEGLDATFLALGTDGRDGPTEHAGAIVDGALYARTRPRLERALDDFDSASFHARMKTAVARFTPLTHLCEAHLLLVRPTARQ